MTRLRADTECALSIIIPLYNRSSRIGGTLASLPLSDEIIRQQEIEIIIVDDGSKDGSAEAAEAAARALGVQDMVHILRQDNAGPGAARNTGAAAARGRLLAFLDSDDFWCAPTLQTCLDLAHHDMALAFLRNLDTRAPETMPPMVGDATVEIRIHDTFLAAVAADNSIRFAACNVVIPRAIFEAHGGFTDQTRCSEDSDLFLRLNGVGPCLTTHGAPLVLHVLGEDDQLSRNAHAVQQGLDFMMGRAADHIYPDPSGGRALKNFLAQAVAYTCRIHFEEGNLLTAYGLILRRGRLLLGSDQTRWIWRLCLYPLLAWMRPHTYRMGRLRRAGR